jgi:uncharacterized protein RhaS with RHS repeats
VRYYGRRYYQPTDGRFLGRDTIGEAGGRNLYAFCLNNGVNRWDYLGMASKEAHGSSADDDTITMEKFSVTADKVESSWIQVDLSALQNMTFELNFTITIGGAKGISDGGTQIDHVTTDGTVVMTPFIVKSDMKLPGDPSGLGPEWTPDPTHQDPNGERFRDSSGRYIDWHKGRPGEPGWKGKDHWHDNGGKEHLPPGTDVPDPAPVPNPSNLSPGQKGLIGAGVVGGGYLIYRGIRMLPSLLPPLWPTIPVNLAVP